jgi:carbohydrate-selective porin OprB
MRSSGRPRAHRTRNRRACQPSWRLHHLRGRRPDGVAPERGQSAIAGVFARPTDAPGDRNLVDLGVNADIALKAPFNGRDNDVAGVAVGYAHVGSHAQDLARSQAQVTPGYPSRSAETVLDATYRYRVAPWWQLQADFRTCSVRPAVFRIRITHRSGLATKRWSGRGPSSHSNA